MTKKEKSENCWQCKYRISCPGSAHSECRHPLCGIVDPLVRLKQIFASVGRVEPVQQIPRELNIKANEYGIRNGWFNFPTNFDPVWLENCDGFVAKCKEGKPPIPNCENLQSCEECRTRFECFTDRRGKDDLDS